MGRYTRYLLYAAAFAGLLAVPQLAVPRAGVSQVATIAADRFTWIFAPVKIEDLVMCENGSEAWAVGIGPGSFESALLFKITGVDTIDPSVDQDSFIEFPETFLRGDFPAGMGPRGYPGLDVDLGCNVAVMSNFSLDTVVKVDLNRGEIVWPKDYSAVTAQEHRSIPMPVDAQFSFPSNEQVYVSSREGALHVLDAATGESVRTIEVKTGGGLGSVVAVGEAYALGILQDGRGAACIDLTADPAKVTIIDVPGSNPFMAVGSGDGRRMYVSEQEVDSVSVLEGGGCNKRVVAEVPVGKGPRYLALSSDNKFLYVSNSLDNTVSVIDTARLRVVETIPVAQGEPPPLGVVAVSKVGRYLYVFKKGGLTPGAFEIRVFDVRSLY